MGADRQRPEATTHGSIADPVRSAATPFFTAPIAGPDVRRMLLISYCFPPDPSVGSLRWEKLTRLAAERGWVFDVVTCTPTGAPLEDRSRLGTLPPGTRVYGVTSREHPARYVERAALAIVRSLRAVLSSIGRGPAARPATTVASAEPSLHDDARRPHSIARQHLPRSPRTVRDLLRAYFVWVDHAMYSRWARRALRLSLRLARQEDYAAVISSGPPHMAHEAGRAIAARLAVPFVMDMRDPWSLAEHVPEAFASPLWLRLSSRFESRAVAQASVVAANTDVLADALRAAYPDAAPRVITVRNGSDDEDPLPRAARGRRFVIAYPGIFYGFDTIRVVFEATARAATACQATAEDIGVEIIGPFSDEDIARLRAIAESVGAGELVNIGPARPRADALSFMATGSMLVALPGHNVMTVIPSKLYEYARLDAWVLALAEPSSALERVLRGTTADVVGVADVDAAARAIERRFREHRAGAKATPIGADGQFSRRAQAALLFDAITACTKGAIASATRDTPRHLQRADPQRPAVTADAFR